MAGTGYTDADGWRDPSIHRLGMDDFPLKEILGVIGGIVTIVYFIVKWLTSRLDKKEAEWVAERTAMREAIKQKEAEWVLERENLRKEGQRADDDLAKELHLQRNKLQNMALEHKVLELQLAGGAKDNEILQLKLNEVQRQHREEIRNRDSMLQEAREQARDLSEKVRQLTRRVEELTRRLAHYEPDNIDGAQG
jgi:predicted RNase H-like nuclease (RuvC/YqgF family)